MATKVIMQNGALQVPDNPITPFSIGDGTGPDTWCASQRILDSAVNATTASCSQFGAEIVSGM